MKRLRRADIATGECSGPVMPDESNGPNRITPPSKKRRFQFGQSSNVEGRQTTRLYEHFRQLDPSNPVEAKRIDTRKKQVQKGKNTIGYDLYIQKVPKHNRRKILEHPSTPDYKADIPNRRWLGQLKAWRISLHQYDPKDMKSELLGCETKELNSKRVLKVADSPSDSTIPQSVKRKQIEDATKEGLRVDFDFNQTLKDNETDNHDKKGENGSIGKHVGDGVYECTKDDVDNDLDKWESNRMCTAEEELLDFDDSDDDDDIL